MSRPLAILAALLLFSISAAAQRRRDPRVDLAAEADLQFELGVDAQQHSDFRGALEHYLQSNRLVYNKNVVYNIARCYEGLGRFNDAFRYYSDYAEEELEASDRAEVDRALARIRPRVALIVVESDPPGASIFLERTDLGERGLTPRTLPVDPGAHHVILELDGHESARADAQARLGQTVQVSLHLTPILGSVRVVGEPAGAEIRVDEEQSPVVATVPGEAQIVPGHHAILVSAPGHQTVRLELDVRPRETVERRVRLVLQTGSVLVDAQERGALIEIDGNAMGFTPTVLHDVPAGPHTIRIARSGFRAFEEEIDVQPSAQTDVQVRLRLQQEVTAASRTAESVFDAPASVSIIPQEELRAFGFQTIWDAVGGVRGIYQSNDGSYQSIGVRGFSQPQDYGNHMLVLNDGHSMNDDLLGSSYVGYDARADLLDVERIEVVRGPGSALYGTNAFFGVINLVTRDRDTFLRPHASLATDGFRSVRLRVGGGVRFSRDSGFWASASGIIGQGDDFYLPELTMGGDGFVRNADGFVGGTVATRAWWGDFTLQAFFNRRRKAVPTGAFGSLLGDPRTQNTDSRGFVELRWEPHFSEEVSLFARLYSDYYGYEGDFAYDAPDGVTRDRWNGLWLGGEARVIWHPASWLRVTAGAESRGSLVADLSSSNDSGGLYLNGRRPWFVFGGYSVAEIRPVDELIITAGARFDYVSTFAASPDGFNPRVSILLRPWSTGTFKLMGGGAFRAPSIYELYYNDNGVSQIAPTSLNAERIWSGELEFTQRIDDELSVVGTVYANYINNLITLQSVMGPMGTPVNQYTNNNDPGPDGTFGTSDDRSVPSMTMGGEVEMRREWRGGWMASASYSFQRTRFGDLFSDAAAARITNSPEHLISFRGAAPLIPEVATLALRLRFESPRLGNKLALDGTSSVVETPIAVLADLVLSGEFRDIGLSYALGVRNLFDWRYAWPGGGGDVVPTLIPQPGRTFFVQTTLTF